MLKWTEKVTGDARMLIFDWNAQIIPNMKAKFKKIYKKGKNTTKKN
jgi:hypothetical protein